MQKTPKQQEAIRLMAAHTEVLLEGGARSGKTFIALYAIVVRALRFEGSQHLVVRRHLSHITASLWSQSLPKLFKIAFADITYTANERNFVITLPNRSQIWFCGTDDKERVEKLLGQEWDTIYINEASQIPYHVYSVLITRLNPRAGMRPLLLLDYNPPSRKHWGYVIFHEGKNYESRQPLTHPTRYARIQMNPADNAQNLSAGYLESLRSLSEAQQRRFLRGEYSDDTADALFKREWVIKNRILQRPDNIHRVVVAVDPNVTEDKKATDNTAAAGIITVGQYTRDGKHHYCVLADDTVPDLSWGAVAVAAYYREGADKLVAEINQGGDLVRLHIRNHDRDIADHHYVDVRATRGKEIRAEPVADLYRLGYIHHVGEFSELEDELCTWVAGEGRSPNRLDALVWGVSFLAGLNNARASIKYDN